MEHNSREEFITKILHHAERVIDSSYTNSFGVNKIPLGEDKEFYKGMQEGLILALECLSHTDLNESNPSVVTYIQMVSRLVLKINKLISPAKVDSFLRCLLVNFRQFCFLV